MAQSQTEALSKLLRAHKPGTGSDRYARFASNVLKAERTYVLEQLSEALDNHRQIVAVGGNGVGKSYAASALGVSALYCNADTTVPITAGNGDTVRNSIWKPIKSMHRRSGLPGRSLDNSRELRTEFEENWYLQCLSPRHPEDLEGDHNETVVYVIEEAEKPGVSDEHIDSARSTLTSENDRLLVLANPPTDEGNVVSRLIDDPEWHTLKFPSWESQNIRTSRGLEDTSEIKGLATVDKLERDWREYHDEPWPGLEKAIEISCPYLTEEGGLTVYDTDIENPEFRDDLHERWYKRRAGIIPPDGSDSWRPWSLSDVEAAYKRDVDPVRITPEALGVDVADKVDKTVAVGLHEEKAVVEMDTQDPLPQQQEALVSKLQEWPSMDGRVDAIGKGAQLAQELKQRFPGFYEFGNNEVAADDAYRTKWDHGLQLIGEWLRSGGSFEDKDLYEELKVGARILEFERNHLRSRGDVIEATKKEDLKEALGRSPDTLDALLMAVTARETDRVEDKASPTFQW